MVFFYVCAFIVGTLFLYTGFRDLFSREPLLFKIVGACFMLIGGLIDCAILGVFNLTL